MEQKEFIKIIMVWDKIKLFISTQCFITEIAWLEESVKVLTLTIYSQLIYVS